MGKYTEGPWETIRAAVPQDGELDCGILGRTTSGKLRVIAEAFGRVSETDRPDAYANASRIVACVNACEGIADPSVVSELMKMLKRLSKISTMDPAWDEELLELIDRAEGKL